MAIETLKDVEAINGFKVWQEGTDCPTWRENRPKYFIVLDREANSIAFKIQNGPVKAVGENGCQVREMIKAARLIIKGLNDNFPCRENSIVITKLQEAEMWLDARTKDREVRNVEGLNKA